jgi:hypothetical protein
MNVHKNARLTRHGRERIVRQIVARANAAGRRASRRRLPADSPQMGDRYRREGLAGLGDRSSRPHIFASPRLKFAVADLKKAIRLNAEARGVERLHLLAHSRGTDLLANVAQQLAIEAYVSQSSLCGAKDRERGVFRSRY